MTVANIKKQALALKPAQRIRLVQEIWDSIAEEPENVKIPDWHRELLDERLRAHERDPGGVITYAELKRRVNQYLKRKRAR